MRRTLGGQAVVIAVVFLARVLRGKILVDAAPIGPQTKHCTRPETQLAVQAFDSLAVCIPAYHNELDEALLAQADTGLILGSLNLNLINTCLVKIKGEEAMTQTLTNDCKKAISTLAEQGRNATQTPASKVAGKLSEDPTALCACVAAINVGNIKCDVSQVVPAISSIAQTCQLLLSSEVQHEIVVNSQGKLQHETTGNTQVSSPPTTAATSTGATTTTPPPGPTSEEQLRKQQQQQQQQQELGQGQQVPITNPTSPQTKPPQSEENSNDYSGLLQDEGTQQYSEAATRCYEAFHAVCPDVSTDAEFKACAERAVKAKKLEPICVLHVMDVRVGDDDDDDNDSPSQQKKQTQQPQQQQNLQGGGAQQQQQSEAKKQRAARQQGRGSQGQQQQPQTAESKCAAMVVSRCMAASTQAQLDRCVHNMVAAGDMEEGCLKYMTGK